MYNTRNKTIIIGLILCFALATISIARYGQSGKFSNVSGVVTPVTPCVAEVVHDCISTVLWVDAGDGPYPFACYGVDISAQCNDTSIGDRVLISGHLLVGSSIDDSDLWASLLVNELTFIGE